MNKFTKLVLWQIVLIAATFFTKHMTEIYGTDVPTSLAAFAFVFGIAALVAIIDAAISISEIGLVITSVFFIIVLTLTSAVIPLFVSAIIVSVTIVPATIIIVKASNLQFFWVLTSFLIEVWSIFSIMYFDGAVRNSFVITGISLLILLIVHGMSHDLRILPPA